MLTSIDSIGPFGYVLNPAQLAMLDARKDGTLSFTDEVGLYSFVGDAGRTVTVSAYWGQRNNNGDGGVDERGRFRLIAPDGSELAAPANESSNPGSGTDHRFSLLDEFVLPVAGTYYVEVYASNRGTGNYWLGISNPLENVQPLSLTGTTSTAWGVRGDTQEWEFNLNVGQDIAWSYSSSRILASWEITDASGQVVASGTPNDVTAAIGLIATTNGIYKLVMNDAKTDTVFSNIGHIGPFGYSLVSTYVGGDFDQDGDFDEVDLDMLIENIAIGPPDPLMFDLTGNGIVNLADRDAWLAIAGASNLPSAKPYLLGDANLDGVVDGQDFIRWNANKFTSVPAWSAGDFNADGVVDGQDFIIWNANKFTSAFDLPASEGSDEIGRDCLTPSLCGFEEIRSMSVDRLINKGMGRSLHSSLLSQEERDCLEYIFSAEDVEWMTR